MPTLLSLMGDSDDHTDDPTDEQPTIERRRVLQATGAAGFVPIAGLNLDASSPSTASSVSVPDVVLSNLSDRTRTLELRLGTSPSGVGVQTDRTTVSLAPWEATKIASISSTFDSTVIQTFGEAGSATVAISDADDRYDSLSIDAGLGDSNRIVDVVAYPDELRMAKTHFDSFGFAGGESR
ncbi:hypothetical protein [Halovivax cerinus]|uniref:Uncharacterized protein n=1 Tax=Halovivax cerinus TaxID=1487865 RepID=A0ABD5NKQ3_9EURY|nr:hypothetical protein [Halovivax cerinus]